MRFAFMAAAALLATAAFFAPGARAQVAASEVWLLAPITPGDCVQFGAVFGSLVDSGGACGGGGGTLAVTATT